MLDGNKRLGAHVMLVFLALNGYELSYSQKELIEMIEMIKNLLHRWDYGILN